MSETTPNILTKLSASMVAAVDRGGTATVLVDARHRIPASGIAFAADLILTANHVLERDEDVKVVLPDGSELSASLAGRDPGSDLALLRLEKASAAIAETAPQPAQVGQLVLALGRPTQEGIQASLGIVSAVGGPVRRRHGGLLEQHLRTDAIPYPGFSGGPLVDSAGLVLGINTSGLSRHASLTIPTQLAWQIAGTLAESGSIRRGYLGVRTQLVSLPPAQQQALERQQENGVLLVEVVTGGPAEISGLLVGDIVVGIGGEPVA
ncbi:MAG: S1C family serine protease, partial [Anaerolineales bacterium]|nr:S1C family serine protease [Anaerolineales bacterium]